MSQSKTPELILDRDLNIAFKSSLILYEFLKLIVGPLSVYDCTSNRTFLLVDCFVCLVRT